jgi:hypothetical protein
VLQSPVLDYGSGGNLLPTYGLSADYYGKGTARGAMSEAKYADYLRSFTTFQFGPVSNGTRTTSDRFKLSLSSITGIAASNFDDLWDFDFLFTGLWGMPGPFAAILYPDSDPSNVSFNAYDLRTSKDIELNYDISFYEDAGFYGAIKPYLLEEFNYQSKDPTQLYGADVAFGSWKHNHSADGNDTSVPDIVEALTLAPDLRTMVVHGYHDTVCPFYQTEVDLLNGGALPQFADRISVKDYDGGHMTYLTPKSHVAIRADLQNFYNPPKTVASLATTSVAAR